MAQVQLPTYSIHTGTENLVRNMVSSNGESVPLLVDAGGKEEEEEGSLSERVKEESKKLWRVGGPAVFTRITTYSMNVVTLAFSGHIGDTELAAMSITNSIFIGFSFGLLLGMASALETLCGQAFGARRYSLLGIYLQRSWIVLFACTLLLLPSFIFAKPILKAAGMTDEIAAATGAVTVWAIPQLLALPFMMPLNRFLQCQMKNMVTAWISGISLVIHVFINWLFVYKLNMGVYAAAMTMNFSWWLNVVGFFAYATCGGCPLSWCGFSWEAFSGLWPFIKLSAASGVMLCMNINGWQMMIPFALFAATGVRVSNELGAGNGRGAKFATVVAVVTSSIIGAFFFALVLTFHDKFALIFTTSKPVMKAADELAILLAFTILLNSVQPILSGVAVGSGWQAHVAYINFGSRCKLLIFDLFPTDYASIFDLRSSIFDQFGTLAFQIGMIGGTLIQTLILAFITSRCNWDKEAEEARIRVHN
ncbi:hypothetical protein ACLOJK_016398 [Asimina triloba]